MATTNFLQFDTQQTNMLSDSEYQTDRERLSGFTTGISRSILFNKAVFQASTMATALATVITNRGFDALDNNLNSLVQAINTAFPESRGLPVGSLLPVTQLVTRVPEGFLLPDGEPFDPAEYPELAAAYRLAANTYAHGQVQRDGVWWPKTPNLRGYFIRVHQNRSFESGFPDGGRQWGSTQTDSIRSHTHNLKVFYGQENTSDNRNSFIAGNNYAASAPRGMWNTTTNANNQVSIASTGGTETRPYNVALTHLIVAKTGVNLGSLQGGIEWGQIAGDITAQADLQEALESKSNKIVKGTLLTLTPSGWNESPSQPGVYLQTKTGATGITSSSLVWVAPAPSVTNVQKYVSANVICYGQGENRLMFSCTELPSENINVNYSFVN